MLGRGTARLRLLTPKWWRSAQRDNIESRRVNSNAGDREVPCDQGELPVREAAPIDGSPDAVQHNACCQSRSGGDRRGEIISRRVGSAARQGRLRTGLPPCHLRAPAEARNAISPKVG